VDITDPTQPRVVGETAPQFGANIEESKPFRVGGRTYLAVALYWENWYGLKVFDVTDPARPSEVSYFEAPQGVVPSGLIRGVAHFGLARQGGRILALLGAIGTESWSSGWGTLPGFGDLLIVDVSDPTRPALVGEWGVLDEPTLGPECYRQGGRGDTARPFLEKVSASADGRTAYLAYADFGAMVLDISDPSRPKLVGHAGYGAGEQGDAFDARAARGGTLLLRTSRPVNAFRIEVSSNAYSGIREGGTSYASLLWGLPDRTLNGEVLVPADSGCSPYTVAPGTIVVAPLGPCPVSAKVGNAKAAGAAGIVLFDSGPYAAPDFQSARGTSDLPGFGVGRNTGLCLAQAKDASGELLAEDCVDLHGEPTTIQAAAVFTGYGSLDIFDTRSPARPVKLGTFRTPHTTDLALALSRPAIPPYPNFVEVVGSTAYVSWGSDLLRVVDFSNPRSPREVGAWTGEGAPVLGNEPSPAAEQAPGGVHAHAEDRCRRLARPRLRRSCPGRSAPGQAGGPGTGEEPIGGEAVRPAGHRRARRAGLRVPTPQGQYGSRERRSSSAGSPIGGPGGATGIEGDPSDAAGRSRKRRMSWAKSASCAASSRPPVEEAAARPSVRSASVASART
jgi:hypothetical protein